MILCFYARKRNNKNSPNCEIIEHKTYDAVS